MPKYRVTNTKGIETYTSTVDKVILICRTQFDISMLDAGLCDVMLCCYATSQMHTQFMMRKERPTANAGQNNHQVYKVNSANGRLAAVVPRLEQNASLRNAGMETGSV